MNNSDNWWDAWGNYFSCWGALIMRRSICQNHSAEILSRWSISRADLSFKTPMDQELLSKLTPLNFIGRAGAGLDQIDLEYLKLENIKAFSRREGNRDAVAEHAFGGCFWHYLINSERLIRKSEMHAGIVKENRVRRAKVRLSGLGFGIWGKPLPKTEGVWSKSLGFLWTKYKDWFWE